MPENVNTQTVPETVPAPQTQPQVQDPQTQGGNGTSQPLQDLERMQKEHAAKTQQPPDTGNAPGRMSAEEHYYNEEMRQSELYGQQLKQFESYEKPWKSPQYKFEELKRKSKFIHDPGIQLNKDPGELFLECAANTFCNLAKLGIEWALAKHFEGREGGPGGEEQGKSPEEISRNALEQAKNTEKVMNMMRSGHGMLRQFAGEYDQMRGTSTLNALSEFPTDRDLTKAEMNQISNEVRGFQKAFGMPDADKVKSAEQIAKDLEKVKNPDMLEGAANLLSQGLEGNAAMNDARIKRLDAQIAQGPGKALEGLDAGCTERMADMAKRIEKTGSFKDPQTVARRLAEATVKLGPEQAAANFKENPGSFGELKGRGMFGGEPKAPKPRDMERANKHVQNDKKLMREIDGFTRDIAQNRAEAAPHQQLRNHLEASKGHYQRDTERGRESAAQLDRSFDRAVDNIQNPVNNQIGNDMANNAALMQNLQANRAAMATA